MEGRDPKPSASVIESQGVKTTLTSEEKGYDAGKKVKRDKRHIIIDTIGLLLHVVVHGANIQDRDGAKQVLQATSAKQNRLQLVWADGGYTGKLISWVKGPVRNELTFKSATITLSSAEVRSQNPQINAVSSPVLLCRLDKI